MSNHFHVIDPQGIAHTRTSAGRNYTHTVLVRLGRQQVARYYAAVETCAKNAGESWDRIRNEAKGIFPKNEQWRGPNALASWKAFAIKWIAEHPETREEAVEAARVEATERARAYEASDHWQKFLNVGWCGRPDLAAKLASKEQGEEVIILPAQPGKPPKGAAKGDRK